MPPRTSQQEEPAPQEQSRFAPTSPWTDALHKAWMLTEDEAETNTSGEEHETPDQTAENALNDAYNG